MAGIVNVTFASVVALGLVMISACEQSAGPQEEMGEIVYFNSFESTTDTVGWWGYAMREFRSDAPREGGRQSLFVSGGCPVPHAAFDLPPMLENSSLVLRCWGKNLSNGGSAGLELSDEYSSQIEIGITDTVWTSYTSSETLFCPANQRVCVSLTSGGIAPSAMLVDLLEVIRVR